MFAKTPIICEQGMNQTWPGYGADPNKCILLNGDQNELKICTISKSYIQKFRRFLTPWVSGWFFVKMRLSINAAADNKCSNTIQAFLQGIPVNAGIKLIHLKLYTQKGQY